MAEKDDNCAGCAMVALVYDGACVLHYALLRLMCCVVRFYLFSQADCLSDASPLGLFRMRV